MEQSQTAYRKACAVFVSGRFVQSSFWQVDLKNVTVSTGE
jgi:hypothetical protein